MYAIRSYYETKAQQNGEHHGGEAEDLLYELFQSTPEAAVRGDVL